MDRRRLLSGYWPWHRRCISSEAGSSKPFGMPGVTGLNLYSFLVAVLGAVVLLVASHAIRGGR